MRNYDDLEERLRRPRKKRLKVKVVGRTVFKLRNLIIGKRRRRPRA